MNPKGFGFGTVRKSSKKRCGAHRIESANNMGAGCAVYIVMNPAHLVGGLSVIKTGVCPKTGGVMLFGDFLNPPDRQISLAALFLVISIKIFRCFLLKVRNNVL